MSDQLKGKVVRGMGWSTIQTWGSKLVSFLVYPILARLLGPESYGLVALAGIYIAFLDIFSDVSFGAAIEQRKTVEPEHLDSIFWAFLGLGVVLTAATMVAAPLGALYFDEPRLTDVIRWLSLGFLLQMVCGVQTSLMRRNLRMKTLAGRDLAGILVGSAVGITMAVNGFGVWSIVAQRLVNRSVSTIVLWRLSDWRPQRRFSLVHLRDVAGFGFAVMGSRVLHYLNRWIDQLLIGRVLGTVQLGLYFNATQLNTLATGLLIGAYSAVSMPALARMQDDLPRFRAAFAKSCRFISLAAFPTFAGLSVMAFEVIEVLLGDKWQGSAPVLQLLALVGMIHTIQYVNGAAMMALGRADLRLKLHVILVVINVVAYLAVVKHGIVAIAAAYTIIAYVWAPVETLVNRRLGVVSLRQLWRAIHAQAIATVVMAVGTWYCRARLLDTVEPAPRLAICVGLGAVTYVAVALALDRRLWTDTADLLRHLRPTPGDASREDTT